MTEPHEPMELHPFDFGLEVGDILRTRRAPGCKWQEFILRSVNRDGSFEMIDRQKGNIRSMLPSTHPFEVKRKGPRGGTTWVAVARREQDGRRTA